MDASTLTIMNLTGCL